RAASPAGPLAADLYARKAEAAAVRRTGQLARQLLARHLHEPLAQAARYGGVIVQRPAQLQPTARVVAAHLDLPCRARLVLHREAARHGRQMDLRRAALIDESALRRKIFDTPIDP